LYQTAGFTLIETLIYLGLFGIIMGSLAVVVYGIVENLLQSGEGLNG
jgi:type II secretory pathway pseudopilin PulG